MTSHHEYSLAEITLQSKDGDWGKNSPDDGLIPYRVIRGTDFPSARIGDVSSIPLRYIPKRTAARRTLQVGDILIETAGGTKDRPTGRTLLVTGRLLGLLGEPTTCASFARFIRVDNTKVDPRYLFWHLQDLYRAGDMWQHQVQHTGVARFQYMRFSSTHKIPLPSIKIQQAIADTLGALDDKIAVNNRIAVTARELGQVTFAAFLKSTTPQTSNLANITTLLTRGIAPKYSEGDDSVVVINQKCIRNGRVFLDPARRTISEKVREHKLLHRDDVLVNSTGVGTLGRVGRWTHGIQATADSHVTIVRFDPAKVDQVCAGFALLAAQSDIEALGEGSTGQTELNRKRLGEYQITLPSDEAMQQMRPVLDSLEARGDAAIADSATLARLRDVLLPKLMSGQIKIRDAEKVVEDAV